MDGQLLDPLRHGPGVAVYHRLLEEDGLEIGGGERGGVDRTEPLLEHQRTLEGLHHGHALVELEPDQQGHRIGRNQRIGLVRLGEEQAIGHGADRTSRHRHGLSAQRGSACA
jgi:hypothetical protein